MSEPALRCPGCGAPSTADAARCDYCGSALATVTCPACFAAMFVGSRFCARCGGDARRELLDDDAPLDCPRCRESMQSLRLGITTARECASCGGLWLDPESLQQLSNAREERSAVVAVLAARQPTLATAADLVRYGPCPRCQKLMNRKNFAGSSGVVLDICATHGVWLDRGELERVLGFVEGGGLTRARARDRERLAEEQRRMAARQMGQSGASVGSVAPASASLHYQWDIAVSDDSLGVVLLDALGDLLRK